MSLNPISAKPVGRNSAVIALIPVLTGSGAYTAGHAVGPLLSFAGAGASGASSGQIQHGLITDNIGQNAAIDLYLFNASIAAIADQAAFSLAKADVQKLIAKISFASANYKAIGTGAQTECEVSGLSIPYLLAANGTVLYGQLVTTGTPTFTHVDDIQVSLGFQMD